MANAWQMHVKKTMEDMKKSSGNATVYLKDVLKKAKSTYKKPAASEVAHHAKPVHHKRKTARKSKKSRRSRKTKKSRKSRKSRK
jgi:hypothetical protein